MKQNNIRKPYIGYIAAVLAVTLVIGVGAGGLLASTGANAEGTAATEAVAVTVSQAATVVESPFTQAVEQVKNSVVGVNNYTVMSQSRGNYYFGYGFGFGGGPGRGNSQPDIAEEDGREVLQGSGSGVVIAQGYVLTNYHVVEGASSLEIASGEDTYKATVVGSDENLDLAILHVEDLKQEPVVLGDSDLLRVGDWAICIGNPLSFTGTTTVGVVSALNREIPNSSTDKYGRRTEYTNVMIQTDAAINSGNSGGGMFNTAGELIGIPSLKYSGSFYSSASVEGIGMAIPINASKDLIQDVLSGKTVGNVAASEESSGDTAITTAGKPRIGVTVSSLNTSNYAVAMGILPTGAYVTDVEKGSPAEKAGMQKGDIVVEVDDTVITTTTQMVSILQNKEAGQTAQVKVYRVKGGLDSIEDYSDIPDGDYVDLSVELAVLDDIKQ